MFFVKGGVFPRFSNSNRFSFHFLLLALLVFSFRLSTINYQLASSLISQRHHRIHPHGSPRRHITRRNRHQREQNRHAHKRRRIARRHLVEHERQRSRRRKRPHSPDRNSNQRQRHRLSHHHAHHLLWFRAQRHPNPDLVRPLCYGVRHHSVNPQRAQKQRQRPEKSHQLHHHAVPAILYCHQRCHLLDGRNRLVRIHRPNRVAYRRCQRRGIVGRSRHKSQRRRGKLRQRNVHLPLGSRTQLVHLDVAHHAHNRAHRMLLAEFQFPSDGIFVRPELPRQRLINHGHGRVSGSVRRSECPPFHQLHLHRSKIIGRDGRPARAQHFARLRSGFSHRFDVIHLPKAAERHSTRHARGNHARQPVNPRQHIVAEVSLSRFQRVFCFWQRHLRHQQTRGVVSWARPH